MRNIIHGGYIYNKSYKKVLDFSANINPLGMPEGVKKAIIDNIDNYMNYPDPRCGELVKAISTYEKVSEDMVVCGNGAADIIYRIALGIKPKRALILAPTFSEYEDALKTVNCKINYFYLNEENDFKVQNNILDNINNVDIVFICNPNNPTGIPLTNNKILKIANKCKENNALLVVDECFVDFLEDEEKYSIVRYIKDYDNVIILKAFTKMYAMAGIRLGYMLSNNEGICYKVSNTLQPWSVSTVASKCGVAALQELDFIDKTKKYIKKNRDYLISSLQELNFRVFPSKVNYILFKCDDINVKNKLEAYGILIRGCGNYINLDDNYFRIAVKSFEDNKKLIEAIKEIKGADFIENNNVNN